MAETIRNRVAVVTGAAQGIGRAIADRLLTEGARVAILDLNMPAAQAAALELGGFTLAVECDVTKARSVEDAMARVVDAWGRIDILVNNAGIVGTATPVRDLSEENWDSVLDVNLRGVFLCSRAVIGPMVDHGSGAIVNIASIAGKEGNPNMAPYAVSKAGVIGFTKSLAREVMTSGVRVNCVAPALIDTPMAQSVEPRQREYLISRIPMGRLGRAEEVAAVVHFLASDEASFVNGQCYDISGGRATY